jgi:hypothetical protein
MRNNGQPGTLGSADAGSTDAGLSARDAMTVVTIACMTMSVGCSDAQTADGGMAQMSDAGQDVSLDGSGPAIGKDAAPMTLTDGNGPTIDAAPMTLTDGAVGPQDASKDSQMPNDGTNIAIPDPMSVMRRLKAVPKHVVFVDSRAVIFVSGRNAAIGNVCRQRALAPLYNAGWPPVQPSFDDTLIPMTMMTDKEMESMGLKKTPVKVIAPGGVAFVPMSIDDWIIANINDLENAIMNTIAVPGDCL